MGGFPSPFVLQATLLHNPVLVPEGPDLTWAYNAITDEVSLSVMFTDAMDQTRIPTDDCMVIEANGIPLTGFVYSWSTATILTGLKTGVVSKPDVPLTTTRFDLIGNLFALAGGVAGRWDDIELEDTS